MARTETLAAVEHLEPDAGPNPPAGDRPQAQQTTDDGHVPKFIELLLGDSAGSANVPFAGCEFHAGQRVVQILSTKSGQNNGNHKTNGQAPLPRQGAIARSPCLQARRANQAIRLNQPLFQCSILHQRVFPNIFESRIDQFKGQVVKSESRQQPPERTHYRRTTSPGPGPLRSDQRARRLRCRVHCEHQRR